MWLREEGCDVALLGVWVGGLLGACEGCRPCWDLWDPPIGGHCAMHRAVGGGEQIGEG